MRMQTVYATLTRVDNNGNAPNKCSFCEAEVLLTAVLRRVVSSRFAQASERLKKELLALAALFLDEM